MPWMEKSRSSRRHPQVLIGLVVASLLVMIGFQAIGTLGRRLVDGADEVRVRGETIKVAAKIHTVGGLSAHADQAGLMAWYAGFASAPPVCLVHGEPAPMDALKALIEKRLSWTPHTPAHGETIEL